jgi:hypothetical protein
VTAVTHEIFTRAGTDTWFASVVASGGVGKLDHKHALTAAKPIF